MIEKRIRTSAKKKALNEEEEEVEKKLSSVEFYLDDLEQKNSVVSIGEQDLEQKSASGVAVTNLGEMIGFDLKVDGNNKLVETWSGFNFPSGYPDSSKKKF